MKQWQRVLLATPCDGWATCREIAATAGLRVAQVAPNLHAASTRMSVSARPVVRRGESVWSGFYTRFVTDSDVLSAPTLRACQEAWQRATVTPKDKAPTTEEG